MNDEVIGYVAVLIAVFFFGTQGVPIKQARTGDGMFFQWVTCAAIWCVGLVAQQFAGNPNFKPAAMLGGFFWCTGNVMVVPIVKTIGFSMGIMIWGVTNLIVGWLTGYVGLFGLKAQTVSVPSLNIIGAVVASVSVTIYALIKPVNIDSPPSEEDPENKNLINDVGGPANGETDDGYAFMKRMTTFQKKLFGVTLSLVSGILYGVNFVPPQYLIDHGSDEQDLIDFVFAHFSGIFITSTAFLLIYCLVKGNKPQAFNDAILPGLVSGTFWGIAQVCFFIANSKLQMVVSFPLISTGPGCVGALWGIFLFKEITGKRNFLILLAAFVVNVVGVVLIVLGKSL